METKEELIQTIKAWVKIDNEVKALQKEVKKRNDDKKKLSESLMNVMKKNEIDCFDIKDGQIMYSKKSVKRPMTKKVLMDVLTKYYKGDFMKAIEVNEYIMDNREETIKETITRKVFNGDDGE